MWSRRLVRAIRAWLSRPRTYRLHHTTVTLCVPIISLFIYLLTSTIRRKTAKGQHVLRQCRHPMRLRILHLCAYNNPKHCRGHVKSPPITLSSTIVRRLFVESHKYCDLNCRENVRKDYRKIMWKILYYAIRCSFASNSGPHYCYFQLGS